MRGLADVEKALELAPGDANFLDARGHMLEAMGRKKLAIESFRQALAKDPSLKASIAGLKRLKAGR